MCTLHAFASARVPAAVAPGGPVRKNLRQNLRHAGKCNRVRLGAVGKSKARRIGKKPGATGTYRKIPLQINGVDDAGVVQWQNLTPL